MGERIASAMADLPPHIEITWGDGESEIWVEPRAVVIVCADGAGKILRLDGNDGKWAWSRCFAAVDAAVAAAERKLEADQ